jgi:tRNA pseudouridine55 synthase
MNGILIVDKPQGVTSHDVVNVIRRKFGIRKVGHAGSLDPIATGVLVILLGTATKLSSHLMQDDKIYETTLRLGIRTDTHDAEGKVVGTSDVPTLDGQSMSEVFARFSGEQWQTPPSFSAVKYKGTPLYKLARRGISVTKEPRKITIHDLAITHINIPDVSFRVHCSKGTYIRQLCDDIGQALGCGAHMVALRRVQSGDFGIEEAVSFETLPTLRGEELAKKLR